MLLVTRFIKCYKTCKLETVDTGVVPIRVRRVVPLEIERQKTYSDVIYTYAFIPLILISVCRLNGITNAHD